jgi:hypothetical protein
MTLAVTVVETGRAEVSWRFDTSRDVRCGETQGSGREMSRGGNGLRPKLIIRLNLSVQANIENYREMSRRYRTKEESEILPVANVERNRKE